MHKNNIGAAQILLPLSNQALQVCLIKPKANKKKVREEKYASPRGGFPSVAALVCEAGKRAASEH